MEARIPRQSNRGSSPPELPDLLDALFNPIRTVTGHRLGMPPQVRAIEWILQQGLTLREVKVVLVVARWTLCYGRDWRPFAVVARRQFTDVLHLDPVGRRTSHTLDPLLHKLQAECVLKRIDIPGKPSLWRLALIDELLATGACSYASPCADCAEAPTLLEALTAQSSPRSQVTYEAVQQRPQWNVLGGRATLTVSVRPPAMVEKRLDPPMGLRGNPPTDQVTDPPTGSSSTPQQNLLGHHLDRSLRSSPKKVTSPPRVGDPCQARSESAQFPPVSKCSTGEEKLTDPRFQNAQVGGSGG